MNSKRFKSYIAKIYERERGKFSPLILALGGMYAYYYTSTPEEENAYMEFLISLLERSRKKCKGIDVFSHFFTTLLTVSAGWVKFWGIKSKKEEIVVKREIFPLVERGAFRSGYLLSPLLYMNLRKRDRIFLICETRWENKNERIPVIVVSDMGVKDQWIEEKDLCEVPSFFAIFEFPTQKVSQDLLCFFREVIDAGKE